MRRVARVDFCHDGGGACLVDLHSANSGSVEEGADDSASEGDAAEEDEGRPARRSLVDEGKHAGAAAAAAQVVARTREAGVFSF